MAIFRELSVSAISQPPSLFFNTELAQYFIVSCSTVYLTFVDKDVIAPILSFTNTAEGNNLCGNFVRPLVLKVGIPGTLSGFYKFKTIFVGWGARWLQCKRGFCALSPSHGLDLRLKCCAVGLEKEGKCS